MREREVLPMRGDIVEEIRSAMPRLRPAERQVAEVLLSEPDFAVSATVASLAERAGVSRASVVRFAKASGFSGFPAFRTQIIQELSREAAELEHSEIAEGRLNPDDTVADMVAKVAFHEARTIEETARLLDLSALDRIAHAIADAEKVVAFGVGASALAAADLAQKLQRIGIVCLHSPDTHQQMVHAALSGPRTVAVAFSFSGGTRDILHALEVSQRAGALTVAVTNDVESPLVATAAEVLRTPAREATLRAAALASRMAQLAVVDFLFLRIGQLRFDDLAATLTATRDAVDEHHLPPRTRSDR